MNTMSEVTGSNPGEKTLNLNRRGLFAAVFGTVILPACGKDKPTGGETTGVASPTPTGAETTTPSATPSATPRPTETPKPSPSPTAETASPSPETPKTPPEIGSIEDLKLMDKAVEEMRKMSDEEWAKLSEEKKLALVSAAVKDAYINNLRAFELNVHIFEKDRFKNRIIANVGSDPDPYDVVVRTLACMQAALASETGKLIPSSTGETNYEELDQTTARRILGVIIPESTLFEKTIERGLVNALVGLPEEISVTGYDKYSKDDEDYIHVRLALKPNSSGPPFTGDEAKFVIEEAIDYAGRPTKFAIRESGLTNILSEYVKTNHKS